LGPTPNPFRPEVNPTSKELHHEYGHTKHFIFVEHAIS
jgi:hypothetical protein